MGKEAGVEGDRHCKGLTLERKQRNLKVGQKGCSLDCVRERSGRHKA